MAEASSRIGLAAAAAAARAGNLVLMGGRDVDACERVAAGLRARGAAAFATYLDLADAGSIDRFVESADYLVGPIDVLVTDAGLAEAPAGPSTTERLIGVQHLAARLVPPMINGGRGDVVLISPPPPLGQVHRELQAWLSVLEAEFVGTGVRASTVRPAPAGAWAAAKDVGCLIAAMLDVSGRTRWPLVEVIPAPIR